MMTLQESFPDNDNDEGGRRQVRLEQDLPAFVDQRRSTTAAKIQLEGQPKQKLL